MLPYGKYMILCLFRYSPRLHRFQAFFSIYILNLSLLTYVEFSQDYCGQTNLDYHSQ